MPTKYSIDGRLLEGFELRGMPVAEFSKSADAEGIRGASKTVLNEAFRDVRPLKNEVAERLWELWKEIDEMAKSFEPFSLDLSDGLRVHDWLKARREGTVYSVVVRPDDSDSGQALSR